MCRRYPIRSPKKSRSTARVCSVVGWVLRIAADRCSRLTIPQTLFGRELELAAELSVEGLVGGELSLLLVSGPLGCGKSSLIAMGLQRLGLSGRVHVAAASYEPDFSKPSQHRGVLRQALNAVVRLILAEDDDAIDRWRQRLNRSLGANGQVMVDLIPELAWLIGPQPALAELAPEAHRNRFLFTLGHFVAAVGPAGPPPDPRVGQSALGGCGISGTARNHYRGPPTARLAAHRRVPHQSGIAGRTGQPVLANSAGGA